MPRQSLVSGHVRSHKQSGYLYAVLSIPKPEGGTEPKWIPTGLKDQRGNKKKADEMLQQYRREYSEKLEAATKPGGDMLFADFMVYWLSIVKKDIKPTTYSGYYGNIHSVIAPYFRELGITIRELTAEHVQDFYDEQLLRVKPTSVLKYHANIHKALRFAAKKKDKPWYKPFFMEEIERPTPNRYEAKFLNEEKILKLVDSVAGTPMELPVLLGAYYGLRRGEVYGLRWSCIDFQANTILINHTVVKLKERGKSSLLFQTPKTKASIRTLPLDPVIKEFLQKVKQEQEDYRKMFGRSYSSEFLDYVHVNPLGDLISPDTITRRFPEVTEKLGFGRLRFHDLRHSCASIMIANGVSMKQVQEWLGHSDYSLTANTYSHLEYQSKLEASRAVNWINKIPLAHAKNALPA